MKGVLMKVPAAILLSLPGLIFSCCMAEVRGNILFLDTFGFGAAGLNDRLEERQSGAFAPVVYSESAQTSSVTNEMLLRSGPGPTILNADFSDSLCSRDFSLKLYMKVINETTDWCAVSVVSGINSTRSSSPMSFLLRGAPGGGDEWITVQYGTGGSTISANLTATFLNGFFGSFHPHRFRTYEIRAAAMDAVSGTFDFSVDGIILLQDLPYHFSEDDSRTVEWVHTSGGEALYDNILLTAASKGPVFTLNYADLLSTAYQTSRTDKVSLSYPLEFTSGPVTGTVTEVSITTSAGSGRFRNGALSSGLSVEGGLNNLWFDSREQIALTLSIETAGGDAVHEAAFEFVGATARAVQGDHLTVASGMDSASATFRSGAGVSAGDKGRVAGRVSFSPGDTVTVSSGLPAASLQNTQLSSLTFRLLPGAPERPAVNLANYLLRFHGNRGFNALDPEQASASTDFDGDGLPNLFEFLAGRDPTRADAGGLFSGEILPDGRFALSCLNRGPGPVSLQPTVEGTADLLEPFGRLILGEDYTEQAAGPMENGYSVEYAATRMHAREFWRLTVEEKPAAMRHVGVAYTTWNRPVLWSSYWGSPQMGGYTADNRNILRRHGQMLADADVDFVFIDWSNNIDYVPGVTIDRPDFDLIENTAPLMFEEWAFIPNAPNIAIMIGFPRQAEAVTDGRLQRKADQVYDQFIANEATSARYYRYLGKPLLLIYTGTPCPYQQGLPPFSDERFTVRYLTGFITQQSNLLGPDLLSKYGYWSWEDRGPQTYTVYNEEAEACTITAASRSQWEPGAVNYIPAIGRRNGQTLIERFQRAVDLEAKLALVVSWNEWTTNEQPSAEVSKDLEPSVEYGTLYLDLLREQVRKFKESGYSLPETPCRT